MSNYEDDAGEGLAMKSLAASDGKRYFEHRFAPDDEQFGDIRSVSKWFTATTLGVAIERGVRIDGTKFSLDLPVWRYLSQMVDLTSTVNSQKWNKVTLLHLLTHTIGFDHGMMFSTDIADQDESKLLEYIVDTEIVFEPGTHYEYSNVGPYLISALLQYATGRTLLDLAAEYVLEPLGMERYEWRAYGEFTAGCTGLHLTNTDMHRLGRCLADGGRFEGVDTIPTRWIDQMRKLRVRTPEKYETTRTFPKYGYGLLTVVTDSATYYKDGANSHYLIVMPSRGWVISTTAEQSDNVPVTRSMRPFVEKL